MIGNPFRDNEFKYVYLLILQDTLFPPGIVQMETSSSSSSSSALSSIFTLNAETKEVVALKVMPYAELCSRLTRQLVTSTTSQPSQSQPPSQEQQQHSEDQMRFVERGQDYLHGLDSMFQKYFQKSM